MKSLAGRHAWPLLKINDDLLDRLRTMGAEGATPAAMVNFSIPRALRSPVPWLRCGSRR